MKISEPATVAQECALPRAFSARSLGYACLLLTALASWGVVAQTTINVTLQPGEFSKTIQAPGAASFTVRYIYNAPGKAWYCNWPTSNQIRARFDAAESAGELPQLLASMDYAMRATVGSNFVTALGPAMTTFFGSGLRPIRFIQQDKLIRRQQLTGPLTVTMANRCLDEYGARDALNHIRSAVRSYLGAPPPTN